MTDQRKRIFPLILIIVLLTSSMGAVGVPSAAQDPAPAAALPEGDGPWVVRAYYSDRQLVDELAAWTEPWEVHHDQGYLVVDVTRDQYQRMLDMGFRLEIDPRLTKELNQPREPLSGQTEAIPGYPCYRTVEETFATAEAIVAAHPSLATWIDVGDSWEKTQNPNNGYDMMVLRLTNATVPGPKPKLFAMGAIHAREYTTAELLTRFAEFLVDNYGLDADVTWLLDYHEIHLMLQSNPDGRKIAEGGVSWRKNTDNDDGCTNPNSWGTDLNRNFQFQWDCCNGSDDYPCGTLYHGPSPASEPETQAVQNYVIAEFPDQREPDLGAPAPITATGVFLDIHSYSELVIWPWGFDYIVPPNGTALQTLGRKFAYYNDYYPEQAIGLYPTDGTTDDFAYGELGLASYCFELGTSFFQNCSTFESTILPDNMPALLYAAKVARTPYMTPAGPDALDLAAVPGGVVPGEPVQLAATIDDTNYSNANGAEPVQNIVAAEYYVDVPPWVTTTVPIPYAMDAVDGAFNETVEEVEGTIDTAGLSQGKHIIFVRGQDGAGNWGAVSAVFLYVIDPAVAPVIEGYVRDASTNAPLVATVTADAFQDDTDPATGYYSMMVISDTYEMTAVAPGYAISTTTGVEAFDYQTVQQDFYLYPVCDVFADDVESGNQGWTAQGLWAITAQASHSPTHSWTDSPNGDYGNNWNYSLISPVFDLSGYTGVTLSLWHIYDLEDGYDYGYVEVSSDGGTTWSTVEAYNGENLNPTWAQETISLPALDGQANARLRFRLDTDYSVVADGWHIDDILLSGGGPACAPTVAPTAEFTSNSPVTLGSSMVFTNQTTGTLPIDYWWSFGDGDTSTESDPEHLYPVAGTFTVTLVATNTAGSDSVDHSVVVLPGECIDLNEIAIAGDTMGEPGTYTFTTSYEPLDATAPITYTWDNGDDTGSSVRTLEVGIYTLSVTATNCADALVTDTHTIVISEPAVCTDVTEVDLALLTPGTIYTDTLVELSADVAPDDAAKPYTFTVDYGDGMAPVTGSSGEDPLVLTYTYDTTGTYEIGIAIWNCEMAPEEAVTDTLTLTVREAGVCVDLSGIAILGETAGLAGTYTFTTSYQPVDASLPITYTWDNGDASPASVRALEVGTHTLVVTATNCADALVTDTHTIVIGEPGFYVYLPLVVKGLMP